MRGEMTAPVYNADGSRDMQAADRQIMEIWQNTDWERERYPNIQQGNRQIDAMSEIDAMSDEQLIRAAVILERQAAILRGILTDRLFYRQIDQAP